MLEANPEENSLILRINDINGHFHSGYFHVHESIFGTHGSLQVDMRKVGLVIGLQMTQQLDANNRTIAAVEPVHTQLTISKKDLDITISGSIISKLEEFIAWIFQNTIIGII